MQKCTKLHIYCLRLSKNISSATLELRNKVCSGRFIKLLTLTVSLLELCSSITCEILYFKYAI